MSLLQEIRELPSGIQDLRKFGITVGLAFLVIYLVIWQVLPRVLGHGGSFPFLLYLGGALIVLGAVLPAVLKPVYFAWMSLALALGFVMTRVILTVFYGLVLIPVGLLRRVLGKDSLNRKIDRQATTYWLAKEYPIKDRSRMEKFF